MDIYEQVEELEDLTQLLFEAMTFTQANNPAFSHVKRLSFMIFEKTKDLKHAVFTR